MLSIWRYVHRSLAWMLKWFEDCTDVKVMLDLSGIHPTGLLHYEGACVKESDSVVIMHALR